MNTIQLLLLGEYRTLKNMGSTDHSARTVAIVTIARRFNITRAHAQMELDAALNYEHATPLLLIA